MPSDVFEKRLASHISEHAVSFRTLSKMSAGTRACALQAPASLIKGTRTGCRWTLCALTNAHPRICGLSGETGTGRNPS